MTDEEIDFEMQCAFASIRGLIQGFKRGFYQSRTIHIRPQCMAGESEEMGFQMYKVFRHEEWYRLYEVPGYLYEIYLSAVIECQIEETIYDLAEFCDENDCSP